MDPPPRRHVWTHTPSWVQRRPSTKSTGSESTAKKSASATRIPISGPISTVSRNGTPLCDRNSAQTSRVSRPTRDNSVPTPFVTTIEYNNNDSSQLAENQRPTDNTSITQARRGLIPKSRTFSVLSSITNSLSRSSLIHHGSTSRNDSSNSSQARITPPVITIPRKPVPIPATRRSMEPLLAESENQEPPCQEPHPPIPDNPRFVTTAMPSQYWSGRFTALHDKFHNEVLLGRNLNIVVEAQTNRSSKALNNNSSAARAAAAQNNPSASAYSVNRPVPQLAGLARYNQGLSHQAIAQEHYSHPPVSRIPQSATSGAILQTTPYSTRTREPPGSAATTRTAYYHKPFSSRPPSYEQATAPGTAPVSPILEGSTDSLAQPPLPTLGCPGPKRSHLLGSHVNQDYYTSSLSSDDSTTIIDGNNAQAAHMWAAVVVNTAATLTDDDARCRRVFVHLEAMCVTETARESLRQWRIAYARKTQRAVLLPCGETLEVRRGQERERRDLIHGLGRGREIVRRLRRSLVGVTGLAAGTGKGEVGEEGVVVRDRGDRSGYYSHAHHPNGYAQRVEDLGVRRRGGMMMGMM
ncbi:hypothetical protein B0T21DRAFT_405523 [Apiosordaria backusii]|uniref:Uncharacterized protein n=1 Tax=Apiosordaria backusii TaxID=314023 RepID=A0AA39ZSL9_9PEZI|nr:hypothetical protein B0T21DRAFT_405523 [Apiosordaria backusii]